MNEPTASTTQNTAPTTLAEQIVMNSAPAVSPAIQEAPAPVVVSAPSVAEAPAAEQPAPVVLPGVAVANPKNAHDYLRLYPSMIRNANIVDTSSFTDLIPGSQMLFKTNTPENIELILLNSANRYWVPGDIVPTNIYIQDSGIAVESLTHRVYFAKTNTVVFTLTDGKVTGMHVIARKDDPSDARMIPEEVAVRVPSTVDELKLVILSVSPRLHSKIKDLTDNAAIRDMVNSFRVSLKDIAHMVKIDEKINLVCSL